MHSITFISTIHKQIGKCNADELCKILEKITPEVVFLEALEDTYSEYQQDIFLNFGVFHEKLEIRAPLVRARLQDAFVLSSAKSATSSYLNSGLRPHKSIVRTRPLGAFVFFEGKLIRLKPTASKHL